MIGLGLIEGGGVSVALIAAVFLSNLPEAISGTTGLVPAGFSRSKLFWMWSAIAVAAAAASVAGYALDTASPETIAVVQGFAGGALLTMLADTMMPEAFEDAGKVTGLFTVLGFALALGLTALE